MGTFKLSNRTASFLLCLLLQGGAFAGKLVKGELGPEGTEQPREAAVSLQKSRPNDAKDGEVAATPPVPAAGEKGPGPGPHPVGAGPGNPAAVAPLVSGQTDEETKKPDVARHPGPVGAQPPAPEPPAGPSAGAQDTLGQQQGNPPPQAEAAPDTPEANKAPAKHASASPQETVKAKPSLHPGVSQKSPSAAQVGGLGQALGAGKAPGIDPVDASPVNSAASGDKVNNKVNLPAAPSPTGAPTTKATKPTPTTTVVPSRPSQDKELLNTKPTDMLLDVPKDSGGVPPPSPGGLSSDYSHAREPDSEEELEPLAPKEPSPMLSGAASVGAQPVAGGPAGDSRPEKPLDASGAAGSVSFPPAQDDSHFFAYFLTAVVLCVVGYLAFHNKRKILALILEGRHERQRRHNGHYRRLDSVDDTSSSRKGRGSF